MKQELPDYMIPMAFVELDTLPLTPNGKVDRRAFPAPDLRNMDQSKTFISPRNATEEVLAGIWCEVLGLDQIGTQDNFFERGGHSLLVIQVGSRISQAFYDLKVPLRKLFEFPTVSGLAVVIERLLIEKLEALGEEDIQQLAGKKAGNGH
jgi:acyl carrier protein